MGVPGILITASPRRVSDGVVQTVRLAGGFAAKPYAVTGFTDAWGGLVDAPDIRASLGWDASAGRWGGNAIANAVTLRWVPSVASRLDTLGGYYWPGAAVTVQEGDEQNWAATVTTVLTARATAAQVAGDPTGVLGLLIGLADPAADLFKPVLNTRFTGAGGLEGDATVNNRAKRRAWGRCFNVEAKPLITATNIYELADPAFPMQAVDQVYDRGNAAAALTTVAWAGSAAATLTALQAAAAPSGGAAIAPSIACIKWWTAQARLITADIRGEVGAGYVETAPEIAAAIAAARSSIGFASGTVAAARTARPDPFGWMVDEESTQIAGAIEAILGGVSLWWTLSPSGQIVLGQWSFAGAPAASLKSNHVQRLALSPPVRSLKLGYKRNNREMAAGDIAGAVLYGDGTPIDMLQPANAGATRNALTVSTTAPSAPINGDLWVDTSSFYAVFMVRQGGIWVTGANALTQYNRLSGTPVALAEINATESSKLAGIEAGATVGARIGTNIRLADGSIAPSTRIDNAAVGAVNLLASARAAQFTNLGPGIYGTTIEELMSPGAGNPQGLAAGNTLTLQASVYHDAAAAAAGQYGLVQMIALDAASNVLGLVSIDSAASAVGFGGGNRASGTMTIAAPGNGLGALAVVAVTLNHAGTNASNAPTGTVTSAKMQVEAGAVATLYKAGAAAFADVTALQPVVSRLSPATGNAAATFYLANGLPPMTIVYAGEARDGDVISFGPFARVPQIIFLPGGNSGTAGQNIAIQALGLSVSGFTLRAKSQSVTPGAAVSDSGFTAGGAGQPARVINRTSASHPYDNRFRYRYSVNVGNIAAGEPGSIEVGVYAKIGGSWGLLGSRSHGASGTYDQLITVPSVDFGAGSEFGVQAVGAEGAGTALGSFLSVSYTPGSVTETSLTPIGASGIPYMAII